MIRGDTKNFNFKVKRNGVYIDGSIYTEVEVQFNQQSNYFSIKKLKSKDEVEWSQDHFSCFLTQEETFKLNDGSVQVQVRLFVNGNCKATMIKTIDVGKVLSSEVLD